MMREPRPSEMWRCGGIISEIEWGFDSTFLGMWDGSRERVEPGDKVLVFRRGVQFVQFVGVNPP